MSDRPPVRTSRLRAYLTLFTTAAVVLALDQAAKAAIVASFALGESRTPIPALDPFFRLTYSLNTGAAFGFLPDAGNVFLVLALVITVGLILFYPRIPASARLARFGLALVLGGALGNAVDRIAVGAVIDFIHYTIPGVISNVSNLADHAIVAGVFLTFIDAWRTDAKPAPETPPADAA
jgi:signal peptidase II